MTKLFSTDDISSVDNDDQVDLDKLYEDNVGEGKRYQDPKVLFKGKYHADLHIRQLEEELKATREDLKARMSVEEALAKLSASKEDNQSHERNDDPQEKNVTALTPETIQKLIDAELEKRTKQSQVQRNQEYVVSKLKETWGDDYQVKLRQRAKELNLGSDFLTELAQTQPEAFLAIVGTPKVANPNLHTPPQGRSGIVGSSEKTWSYYNKLRREQPSVYRSKQIQKEIHEQAAKLGEAFYNN